MPSHRQHPVQSPAPRNCETTLAPLKACRVSPSSVPSPSSPAPRAGTVGLESGLSRYARRTANTCVTNSCGPETDVGAQEGVRQPKQSRGQRPPASSRPGDDTEDSSPGTSPSSEARGAGGAAQNPGCVRDGTATHLSPETASPGSRGLLAGRGRSPPAACRGGRPRRRRGLRSPCPAAGPSPRPGAAAPGARARGAGAVGRAATQHGPARATRTRAAPHLPWAAEAPGGPASGTGGPRRPAWRTGVRPPSPRHPGSQPASLRAEPEAAPG